MDSMQSDSYSGVTRNENPIDAARTITKVITPGTKRLFTVLQEQSDWIDVCGTTKTAYAYIVPVPQVSEVDS